MVHDRFRADEALNDFLKSGAGELPQDLRDFAARGGCLTLYPGVMNGTTVHLPGSAQRSVTLEVRDGVIRLIDSNGPTREFDAGTGLPIQVTESITPPPSTSSPR